MVDVEELEEQGQDLSNSDVVTKYKQASEICNKVMLEIQKSCQPGAKIATLCDTATDLINKEVSQVFKGKKIEKGVAMPPCVSVNECIGHFSPDQTDEAALKEGDVAKVSMGVHIDGFIALQAQTLYIQPDFSKPVTGRAADVMQAAMQTFNSAIRLIKPGNKVSDVSSRLESICNEFGCSLVEGVMTHQMKQFVIDGQKCVLNKTSKDMKVEDRKFEEYEVYAVDIVVSTGKGVSQVTDEKKTTVFKRAVDQEYSLKLRASRAVYHEVSQNFPFMPFCSRWLGQTVGKETNRSQIDLGLKECITHGLLNEYPVLYEKSGELVAQVQGTILLMPNGNDLVTGTSTQVLESDKKITIEEINTLLAEPLKRKKKKKKAAQGGEAGGNGATA